MGAVGLTPRQHDLLTFIAGCEICPTFEEMRVAIGAASKYTVAYNLDRLSEKGFIRRLHDRRQAIEVLILPKPGRVRLRVVPIANVPAHPIAGSPPTAAPWEYPFRSHRYCSQWGDAEVANAA